MVPPARGHYTHALGVHVAAMAYGVPMVSPTCSREYKGLWLRVNLLSILKQISAHSKMFYEEFSRGSL